MDYTKLIETFDVQESVNPAKSLHSVRFYVSFIIVVSCNSTACSSSSISSYCYSYCSNSSYCSSSRSSSSCRSNSSSCSSSSSSNSRISSSRRSSTGSS